jgi:hypothetical protein
MHIIEGSGKMLFTIFSQAILCIVVMVAVGVGLNYLFGTKYDD